MKLFAYVTAMTLVMYRALGKKQGHFSDERVKIQCVIQSCFTKTIEALVLFFLILFYENCFLIQ